MAMTEPFHDDALVPRRARRTVMPVNRKMVQAEHSTNMEIYRHQLQNETDVAIADIEMEASHRIVVGAANREMESYDRMMKNAGPSKVKQRIVGERLSQLIDCDDATILRTRR